MDICSIWILLAQLELVLFKPCKHVIMSPMIILIKPCNTFNWIVLLLGSGRLAGIQKAALASGQDEGQLRMLKAQVKIYQWRVRQRMSHPCPA